MMEQLPFAVLSEMVEYLNPRERQRFSAANRELRKLFPTPLRIKISSKSVGCSLEETYFCSPHTKPETYLSACDSLIYEEQDYLLWTYDYTRENKVYMCRNDVEWGDTGTFQYLIFSVGLRSNHTRQTIRIMGGKAGAHVRFGDDVGITIGGLDANPTSPDSRYRSYLSVRGFGDFVRWYSMVQEWGKDERLQIHECQGHRHDYASKDDTTSRSNLTIHAEPDIVDGIFHLYSPNSLKHGIASSELVHHKIGCRVWIESGYICAKVDSIPSSFAVPIVGTDHLEGIIQTPMQVLQMFFHKQDTRWEAMKYYWAIALDLTCGSRSHSFCDMMAALASCDNSGTSTIAHDPSRSMVYMQVDDYLVTTRVPDCPVNENELWECLVVDESYSFPWVR